MMYVELLFNERVNFMFRCQVTGQLSEPAVYGFKEVTNEVTGETRKVYTLIKAAEKPVKLVVETRDIEYTNFYKTEEGDLETIITAGSEIAKELTVRACNVELAKKKYGLV